MKKHKEDGSAANGSKKPTSALVDTRRLSSCEGCCGKFPADMTYPCLLCLHGIKEVNAYLKQRPSRPLK